jgi:phosphate transport system substrate-binding protein
MSRRLQRVAGLLLALLCLGGLPPGHLLAAQSGGDTLQSYEPATPVSGDIRIWGSPADAALLREWSEGFRRFQPQARVQATLYGPESTLAGVYCGVADLAFMAREMRLPVENMAFTWVYRYPPFSVEIANAGLTAGRPSATLAVVVNAANPLQHLTLMQLDGILGAAPRRGGANVRKWGDLGLGGIWKGRAIHVYGPPVDSIDGMFMRTVVMQGSYKWNPDYREIKGDDAQVLQAVAQDEEGIAYASLDPPSQHVKPLALSATAGAPFYALTEQNVAARTYPLSRVISMVLNRKPGTPIEPEVKEFLRFILSRDGQAVLARDAHYIPLTAASGRAQLERLE